MKLRETVLFLLGLCAIVAPAYAASMKISDMTDGAPMVGTDCFPSQRGAGNVKLCGSAVNTYVLLNNLGNFAATTSAQMRSVLSDETGTGALVFQGGALGQPQAVSIDFPSNGGYLAGSNSIGDTFLIKMYDNDDAVYRNMITFTSGNSPSTAFLASSISSSALATGLSDETGSGAAVFGTSPTISGASLGSSSTATTQSANDNSTKVATTAYVDAANLKKKTIFEWVNTGTPTVAQQGFDHIAPCAGTITDYSISVDAGTMTVKFWKKAAGTAVATSSDSINTSGVAISSGTSTGIVAVTGDFTSTTFNAGDHLAGEVTVVSGVTKAAVQLYGKCN